MTTALRSVRGTGPVRGLRVAVLGPIQVVRDGRSVRPPRQLARLLAALALDAPHAVADGILLDRLWPTGLPSTARASLQVFVGRLRHLLEPERVAGVEWSVLIREGTGYRLVLDGDQLDRRRVDRLIGEAGARIRSEPARALALLDDALACWHGEPWADVAGEPWIAQELASVGDARIRAESMRVDSLLHLGRHEDATTAARRLVSDAPFDEDARWRLMVALYRSGRQRDALLEFDRARTMLTNEIGVEPGPALQELRTAILDHDPRLASTIESGRNPGGVTNLDHPEGGLVGRGRELDELAALASRLQLVTLVGLGGNGKTRLAVELGWRLLDRFLDGVWFVDLDRLGTDDDVAGEVARALGRTAIGGEDERSVEWLCRFVTDKTMLVILDNCEHLADPVAMVATRLVAAGRGVHVVTTSRRALGAVGEQVFPVVPLPVPPLGARPEEIIASPAVRLFVMRAGAELVDLDDAASLEAVAAVARSLDGVPLALELAASRAHAVPLPELADAMTDRFSALVSARPEQSDRHVGLRTSFDVSHALLGDGERVLFERLGLLDGPVTVDLFGAPGEAERIETMTLLDRLVTSSLVDRIEIAGSAGFRLLPTTRAYARLRLGESAGVMPAQEWLAARVLRFVRRGQEELRGSTQRDALARLDTNYAAVRSFVETLIASGRPELAYPIAVALAPYWFVRPHHGEGPRILIALRENRVVATDPLAVSRLVLADAECGRGKSNALDRLRPALLEALDVFTEQGCDDELLTCIGILAVGAAFEGNLAELQRLRAHAPPALARVGTAWHRCVDELLDAFAAALGGDVLTGLEDLTRVRARFIEVGDRAFAARTSYFSAILCQLLGDEEGFRTNLTTSIELSELAGGCGMDGRISLALADAAIDSSDSRAEAMLLRASDLLERHGDAIGVAKCGRELAALALQGGRADRARELFAQALPVLAELEPPAFALGLAQMLPLIRQTQPPEIVALAIHAVRSLQMSLAAHSSPDVRRLHRLSEDWPERGTDPAGSMPHTEQVLAAVFGDGALCAGS